MLDSDKKQEHVIIKISGMSCNHCSQRVENALQQAKGVNTARVELSEEKAYVEYDSSVINAETLLQIIKDSGYEGALSG